MSRITTAQSDDTWRPTDLALEGVSCLRDPTRLLFTSGELDEVRALVGGAMKAHRLRLAHNGGGTLQACMHHVPLGELSLSRLEYGGTVYVSPEPLDSFYLVTMPLCGGAHIQNGDQRIDSSPELAAVLNPRDVVQMCFHADYEQIILKLSRSLLEQTLASQLGRSLEQPLVFDLGFRWKDHAPWRSLLSYLLACVAQYPDLMRYQLVHAQLTQMVASALLLMQHHNYSDATAQERITVLPRHVRRAQDYIQAHAHEPITTTQLALLSGVSARGLNAGFREFFGVSPMHYLRDLRLQRARDELLNGSGDSVAGVALRWGFEHMGRFAAQYRQAFDESPSQTLRRR